jgi:hypothetical protein
VMASGRDEQRVSPVHDPAWINARIKARYHRYLDAIGSWPVPHAWRCLHIWLACPRRHGWRRFRTIDHRVFVERICSRSRIARRLFWREWNRLRRPSAGCRRLRLGRLFARHRCLAVPTPSVTTIPSRKIRASVHAIDQRRDELAGKGQNSTLVVTGNAMSQSTGVSRPNWTHR